MPEAGLTGVSGAACAAPGPGPVPAPGGHLRALAALVRRLIGVPDYDRYLAHMSAKYPGIPPMDRASFEAERLAARYRNGGGVRCC
jgi:uncharacterized short protein YbdD (DUF466 family)